MKNVALLAIIFHLYINTVSANKTSKANESEEEVLREEFEISLLAKIVPNVVNPPETLKPPEFSVVIFKDEEILGSGAILNEYHVLTLCSLIKPSEGKDVAATLKISYPVFNSSKIETMVQNISATKVAVHPDCGDKAINPAKNLGIIRTKQTMDQVKYPKLPSIHIPEDKSLFIISNFRVFNHAATTTETTIWYVITRKVDNNVCALLFEADNTKFSMNGNLCMTYYHLGGAQSCKSDFGAPLSVRYKDEDTLVGLNLHKHGCGHTKSAASFVCVRTNLNWIEKNIKS